jgi:O-antigen/teichoic acid export membrane protein
VLARYLRFQPYDVATPDGRAQERYRLAGLAIVANAASLALGVLAVVITIPLTLPYLGEERFGVWMTIASLAGMLSFLDLGIGNSLVNRVAAASATGDPAALRRTIARGLTLLSVVGLVIGSALFLLLGWIPMERLIKVGSAQAAQDVSQAAVLFVFLYSASIPLNGISRVFQGLQRAWLSHVARGCGSMVSVVLVLFLAKARASPADLLLATYGVQVFMPLVLAFVLWRENLVGSFAETTRPDCVREMRELAGLGGLFLVLQIGTVIGWGADALIVSSLLGASEVSKLAVVQRLFQFVSVPLGVFNNPLWSPYAEAKARGDRAFIRKTLKRSLLGTALGSLFASSLLFWVAPSVIDKWLGGGLQVPIGLVGAYAVWVVMESTGTALAMFLNGMGEIRSQALLVVAFCVVALSLKLILTARYGVAAVVWAGVLSYFLYMSGYLSIFGNRIRAYL